MEVSILITHYNRSKALIDCIESFKALNLEINFEFIVCDDCSTEEQLTEIRKIKDITLIESEYNRGLGANINKGLPYCSGEFILYCQEDFMITSGFVNVIEEIAVVLRQNKVDMVRLKANYRFPKLISISKNISQIPKFAVQNFLVNAFQYSDNPFVIKKDFFEKNGFYLEDVKGNYCELEYSIRIMKSNVNVAILNQYVFKSGQWESVLNYSARPQKRGRKEFHKFLRAIRLHLECLLYNPSKRVLFTFKKSSHSLEQRA